MQDLLKLYESSQFMQNELADNVNGYKQIACEELLKVTPNDKAVVLSLLLSGRMARHWAHYKIKSGKINSSIYLTDINCVYPEYSAKINHSYPQQIGSQIFDALSHYGHFDRVKLISQMDAKYMRPEARSVLIDKNLGKEIPRKIHLLTTMNSSNGKSKNSMIGFLNQFVKILKGINSVKWVMNWDDLSLLQCLPLAESSAGSGIIAFHSNSA